MSFPSGVARMRPFVWYDLRQTPCRSSDHMFASHPRCRVHAGPTSANTIRLIAGDEHETSSKVQPGPNEVALQTISPPPSFAGKT